jgi:D-arabinose 1-dehydrogenase-like Zn-dependent alcohol dehydrogenase
MGILGLPDEGWRFDADPLVFRELTIKGSYVASREATEGMLEVVAEKGVRSHLTTVSFDQIPDIVAMYRDKSFKGRLVARIGDD